MSTKIEYNNSIVAEIPNGSTAKIPVRGKKMATDILVTVPESSGGDSAVPIEVSTEADMTALLESGEVGGVYKYVGETGTYENGALYVLEEIDYAAELLGTWTLKEASFDASMIGSTTVFLEGDISGKTYSGGVIDFDYSQIAIKPDSVFGLTSDDFNYVIQFYPYPTIEVLYDGDHNRVSYAENITWPSYSTFTINSVTTTDETILSTVLDFLQANATKQ